MDSDEFKQLAYNINKGKVIPQVNSMAISR